MKYYIYLYKTQTRNIMKHIRKIQVAECISKKEVKTLIDGLIEDDKERDALFVRISYSLGLRISDVTSIRWSDFGNGFKTLSLIEKKTKKQRDIPAIPNNLVKALYEYQKNYTLKMNSKGEEPLDLIFHNRQGNQLSSNGYNLKLKEWKIDYLKKNNLRFSSHSFRKSFGLHYYTEMGENHKALTRLQSIYQHKDIATTIKYIGIMDSEIKEAYYINDV